MKAYKVFAIKMEVEMDDEEIQEIAADRLKEMGEIMTPERIFEDYLEDFQAPGEDFLTEAFMDPNPYALKVKNLEVFEIL